MKPREATVSSGKFFKAAGWIAALAAFFILLGASIADTRLKKCSRVYIKIDHDNGLFFVDEEDIRQTIQSYCSSDLEGIPLRNIRFTEIEEKLESNPYIREAEVYSSARGIVYVDVRQREPLLRVVNNSGVSYYLDANGVKIPPSSKFTARVVVATGNDENISDSAVVAQLLKLCSFISENEFWKAQFEQISVTNQGEFELAPKLANHIVRLGSTDDLEGKFQKLMIFYKEVLKNFDADNFRIINLKYKDQIICTKNFL